MKKVDLLTTQNLYYLFLLSHITIFQDLFLSIYLLHTYLFWNPTSFLNAPKCWEFNVLMEPLQDSWWSLFFYFFFLSSFGIKSCKIVEFPDIDRQLTFIISVYPKTIEILSVKNCPKPSKAIWPIIFTIPFSKACLQICFCVWFILNLET